MRGLYLSTNLDMRERFDTEELGLVHAARLLAATHTHCHTNPDVDYELDFTNLFKRLSISRLSSQYL